MSKYIKVEDLQAFCDNQKDHCITPNDFQRFNHIEIKEPHGDWHTGTPTEEGWYLVQVEDIGKTFLVAWLLERFRDELRPEMPQGTVAWQKKELYEAST